MIQDAVVHWFRQIHLFSGLSEEEARAVLAHCVREEYEAGQVFLRRGDWDEHLYLVYEGEVSLWVYSSEGEPFGVGRCISGDYFNVEAAVWGGQAEIYARALRPCVVYKVPPSVLEFVKEKDPDVEPLLRLVARARERGRIRRPLWLKPHELLTLYERPHKMALVYQMGGPLMMGWLGVAFWAWWLFMPNFEVLIWVGAAVILAAFLWAVYLVLEWRNDVSVVTSLRAAYVERVILVYESRQEIPLHMVVAHEVYTSFFDRVWGMGDVIVRTQGPSLRLPHVPYPEAWDRVLTDYRKRHLRKRYVEEEERVERALRERLELPVPEPPKPAPAPELRERPQPMPWWQGLWHALFGARIEEGSIITYRKHWYFLLQSGCLPILGTLATLVFAVLHWLGFLSVFSVSTVTILTGLAFIFAFILFLWSYWEWRNDYYQVTDTQVVDFKKIVFGPEQRHTAPLTEIRSVDYEHPGFLARLLNFGNVYIYTGGDEPLIFQDIANPAQAQYDIFLRLDQLQRQRDMEQWARERQRFIEWLATYHKLAREAFQSPTSSPSASPPPSKMDSREEAPPEPEDKEPPVWTPPPFAPGS